MTDKNERENKIMSDYFGKEIFKLGFGLMRLPKLESGEINIEETCEMVDKFIAAGGTYFDTAYVYDGSEVATKAALVDRYPRETYTLASKINAWMQCSDEEKAKQQFYTSLERTGAGYFDYYLLHSLQRNNYKKYDEYHLWDFVKEQKAKGLIRYYGFSFHSDPALLDELLTLHPDVDFIQLQINYADWENPGVASRECYEIARKHGVSVTVMEPVKGGALANPSDKVKEEFLKADPNASFASWAIRFAASLDGIITVLSGMSNIAQVEDNLSYMKDFRPLGDKELTVIENVRKILLADESIKCTACRYCVEGCPMNIAIPEIFAVKNSETRKPSADGGKAAYERAVEGKGRASDCIECEQCRDACPQHLPISNILKSCLPMEE